MTPPVGIYHRMWGAAKHDQSAGVHRPLTATACVFQPIEDGGDGGRQILVALDHCLLRHREMDELPRHVCAPAGVGEAELRAVFSPTHAAGRVERDRADWPGRGAGGTERCFSGVRPHSIGAVSERYLLLEALAALSILMTHLGRYCEDLILWSSAEFAFVELDDAYSTGSSMMPQKKNPDSLELVRGKTGRVYGDLFALLTTMKGLGLTYGKDLQEDKEPVFDDFSTVDDCLDGVASAWDAMTVKVEGMGAAVDAGTLATQAIIDALAITKSLQQAGITQLFDVL